MIQELRWTINEYNNNNNNNPLAKIDIILTILYYIDIEIWTHVHWENINTIFLFVSISYYVLKKGVGQ